MIAIVLGLAAVAVLVLLAVLTRLIASAWLRLTGRG